MRKKSFDLLPGAATVAACLVAIGCESSPAPEATAVVPNAGNVLVAEAGAGATPTTQSAPERGATVDPSQWEQVYFSVPEMMCEFSCAPKVRSVLAQQPGVVEVEVDLASKTARVKADASQFDPADAIAALADVQFDSTRQITAAEAGQALDVGPIKRGDVSGSSPP